MATPSFKKPASILALIGLFLFSGVALFQLQLAFGWTNPLSNPPTGGGALFVDSTTGNVGIGIGSASSSLTVQGEISATGNRIRNVATPVNGDDAVNKDYVLAQTGGGAGGGSVVLYYKTVNGSGVPSTPTCPTGWNVKYTGYGPHFISVFNYDWQYTNPSGGTSDGGFGGTGGSGSPPPASGSSYKLNSVTFGSDSVCSTSDQSVIPGSRFYSNSLTTGFTTLFADACSTYQGSTHCNRCLVCEK